MLDLPLNQLEPDTNAVAKHAAGLTFVHLRFRAKLSTPDPALRYLGPTLRGCLGYALKEVACSMKHGDCSRCLLRSACAFPEFFGARGEADDGGAGAELREATNERAAGGGGQSAQPFALEVAAPGSWWGDADDLAWGIRLFGRAQRWVPHLIAAYLQAQERGLGPNRTQFELIEVVDAVGARQVWAPGDLTVGACAPRPVVDASRVVGAGVMRWWFRTPVRITRQGKAAPLDDGLSIILAGRRRFQTLHAAVLGAEPRDGGSGPYLDAGQFRTVESQLEPWNIERFSGRQRQRVPLRGMVGEVRIEGPWHLAGPWLHAIEQMHLGKHTTFGFGRVSWEFEGAGSAMAKGMQE